MITCGDEWQKHKSYEQHLISALNSAKAKGYDEVWVNAVLSMKHGMFHFTPHTKFEFNRVKSNALLEFLLFINRAISTYPTFRIDIGRYRPTIPKE